MKQGRLHRHRHLHRHRRPARRVVDSRLVRRRMLLSIVTRAVTRAATTQAKISSVRADAFKKTVNYSTRLKEAQKKSGQMMHHLQQV